MNLVMDFKFSSPTITTSSETSVRAYGSSSLSLRCCALLVYIKIIISILAVPRFCVCQNMDQTYIFIHPQRAFISESLKPTVEITCRHPPETEQSGRAVALTISRTPFPNNAESSSVEELVSANTTKTTLNPVLVDKASAAWSVEDRSMLLLILTKPTCLDALFTYHCHSLMQRMQNSANATFGMFAPPQKISLSTVWTAAGKITLRCQTSNVSGVNTGPEARGEWVWEYNDVGYWTQANPMDVTGVEVRVAADDRCLQLSPYSQLTVDLSSLRRCRRLYRCYIQTGSSKSSSADIAQQFLANKGSWCQSEDVEKPSTVTAIVISLVFMLFSLAAAVLACRCSLQHRRELEKMAQDRAIDMLLTRMNVMKVKKEQDS